MKRKIRETLITFKLHNEDLLSFWRIFHGKIEIRNSWKNSWNFVYICYKEHIAFHFAEFFSISCKKFVKLVKLKCFNFFA